MTAATQMKSVTERLAEWVVDAKYEDLPAAGVERVKERFLDTLGVQAVGMSLSTGRVMSAWVKAQNSTPEASVVAGGYKTTAWLAALANATAGHAIDFDDSSMFSSHPSNPLTSAILALGEKLGCSGQDAILAFNVGWEVICRTNNPCQHPMGHTLLSFAWHNQGFQPALGVAALSAKLMGLSVDETRMALGNAASTMAGMHKNAGSDTKPFHAGNPAMHGIMAAELVAAGFTANEDIFDGHRGAAMLMSRELGNAEQIMDGLGTWDLATNGSWIKIYACNGGGQWSQAAMRKILDRHPLTADEIDSIEVDIHSYLTSELPFHLPQTGLEAKFSTEYDVAAIVLDGRAGMRQYTDAMVQRPEAQELMKRIVLHEETGDFLPRHHSSWVVVNLKNGERLEGFADTVKGQPQDPLSQDEIAEKFHDCAGEIFGEAQRSKIVELCWNLDSVDNLRQIGDAVRSIE